MGQEMCERGMAKEAKVGGVAGSAFGAGREGYIRFSYAASDEKLHEAMKRLKNYGKSLTASQVN